MSINLMATNVSNHTCLAPNNSGLSATATVTNSVGQTVFHSTPFAVACTVTCPHPLLAGGQSTSYGAGTWDNAPRGRNYHAVASRNGAAGSPATFSVP